LRTALTGRHLKEDLVRQDGARTAVPFGPVSRDERRQADLFFADLMGRPFRRRYRPRNGEAWEQSRSGLITGPLTPSEWETVIRILRTGEAETGAPLTDDAARNALLVAARIFCQRNALSLDREDPLLCVLNDVTMADARVRALVPHVTARGPIIHLAGLMRSVGITVREANGWRTRTANGPFEPVGVMMHHTVGLLPGVLPDIVNNNKANFFVDRAGVLTVVAAGRANHAGMGAQRVLDDTRNGIAPTGTAAQRGLPDALIGNGHYYGFENENRGDGVQTWPAVQLATMARGAAALCRRHGWTANRVVAHKEWTSRKPDPAGIDMNTFRASVAALI
jgi:hypothetical protein